MRKRLVIATIFSFAPNGDSVDYIVEDESFDTASLPQSDRDFLEEAIKDYNEQFHTNFDTSEGKFENYYKDVSLKMKERKIDLLIVVNMFLTGFDATTLNTLFVDKNLRYHGLLQAFSRTNRILNSVKTFGNIVCFRDLQKNTDDAIALFGNAGAGGIVLLRSFADYYSGFDEMKEDGTTVHREGYEEMVDELSKSFPLGSQEILGEEEQKRFLNLFGAILRMRNLLSSFDDFKGKEILSDADFQDYQSKYIDLKPQHKPGEKVDITDDIVFETELVRQVEVNIDYILMLVEKYQGTKCQDKEILVKISKAVNSSIELRSKKDLIDAFVNRIGVGTEVKEEWKKFVAQKREEELTDLIAKEKLKNEQARKFINDAFASGELRTIGTEIQDILPPSSPFDKNASLKKATIIESIKAFFEKFIGLFV
jgi:type I restriction enzyme R subunit